MCTQVAIISGLRRGSSYARYAGAVDYRRRYPVPRSA